MLINKENNLRLANTTENILIHYTEHSIVWKKYEILPLPVRDNIWSSNNATDTKRFCKAPPFLHHKIKQGDLSGINHLITPTGWISNSFFKSTSLCVCAYMWSESERGDKFSHIFYNLSHPTYSLPPSLSWQKDCLHNNQLSIAKR